MRILTLFAALAICTLSVDAQDARESAPGVVTRHQVTVNGRVLHYTARAGLMPIRDSEAGELHGQMFFVAYTLDRAAVSGPRPLTFVPRFPVDDRTATVKSRAAARGGRAADGCGRGPFRRA